MRRVYIDQFLSSLSKQTTLIDWRLLLSFEPVSSGYDSTVLFPLVADTNKFVPTSYWVNPQRLGATDNTYEVCRAAMKDPGCEALLYLDDDILLSPDAVALCDWYLQQTHPVPDAGICLCNEVSDPSRPDSISANDTWRGLVGQGYCYTRQTWLDFVKPNFFADNPAWAGHSYDWALATRAQELGRIILRPRYSRSQHIGVVGLHGAAAGVHLEPFPKDFAQTPSTQFILEDQ